MGRECTAAQAEKEDDGEKEEAREERKKLRARFGSPRWRSSCRRWAEE